MLLKKGNMQPMSSFSDRLNKLSVKKQVFLEEVAFLNSKILDVDTEMLRLIKEVENGSVSTHVDTHIDSNIDSNIDTHVDTHIESQSDTHIISDHEASDKMFDKEKAPCPPHKTSQGGYKILGAPKTVNGSCHYVIYVNKPDIPMQLIEKTIRVGKLYQKPISMKIYDVKVFSGGKLHLYTTSSEYMEPGEVVVEDLLVSPCNNKILIGHIDVLKL